MRQARIKPQDHHVWHHCYNRIAGSRVDRPLGKVEKEQFVRILFRTSRLYSVRITSYQVMSNHFHLLVQTPVEPPSQEETCARYASFHRNHRTLEPGSQACIVWQQRLNDISWFMRHLQQLFASWYNRTRTVRRHGVLWAGRFKNTVLEHGPAVYRCWSYIENNPVRAGLVSDAADYRFCSFGYWSQRGHHPFEEAIRTALGDVQEAHKYITGALRARGGTEEAGFTMTTRRRVRFWVDGAVIGSEQFVRAVMRDTTSQHQLYRAREEALYAWRRLRSVPA